MEGDELTKFGPIFDKYVWPKNLVFQKKNDFVLLIQYFLKENYFQNDQTNF